ncbi:amidohydrolase family protein [Elongatibacter sediminis]|uniref:Amidohydrolase family protein n=1 Tax=Elongatibacter sediminis TaxID=3119006 RepID=A0AAW9RCB2_9GAMM
MVNIMRCFWLFVGFILQGAAIAADVDRTFLYDADAKTFVQPHEPSSLYLVGGSLIDGTGAEPRPNEGILIANGRFQSVSATEVPEDVVRIDAENKWILPGLFDLHAHVTFYLPSGFHAEDDVVNAIRTERFLERYQAIGVTTVRDVASRHNVGYSVKRAQRMGLMGGARLYVSGPGITVTGGHAAEFQPNEPPMYAVEADGPWKMRQAVRQAVKMGADLIKVLPPFTEEEIATIVDEAHFWKLPVTAHVGGPQDLVQDTARRAVASGVDSVEHLYPSGSGDALSKLLKKMKSRDIQVIPTITYHFNELNSFSNYERDWMLRKLQYSRDSVIEQLKTIHRAGISLAVGTDSNAIHMLTIADLYASELQNLTLGNLSPMEVIQAATLNSAEAMGIGDELGSIEGGKKADLIIVDQDPLESLASVVAPSWVIQGGKVVHRLVENPQ